MALKLVHSEIVSKVIFCFTSDFVSRKRFYYKTGLTCFVINYIEVFSSKSIEGTRIELKFCADV